MERDRGRNDRREERERVGERENESKQVREMGSREEGREMSVLGSKVYKLYKF